MTTIIPSGALCYDEDELAYRMRKPTETITKKRLRGGFFLSLKLDVMHYYYKDWIDYYLLRDKRFDRTLAGKDHDYGIYFLIPHGRGPAINGGGMEDRYGLYEVSSEGKRSPSFSQSTDDYQMVLIDGWGLDRPSPDVLSRYFAALWQAQ